MRDFNHTQEEIQSNDKVTSPGQTTNDVESSYCNRVSNLDSDIPTIITEDEPLPQGSSNRKVDRWSMRFENIPLQ